LMTTRRTRIMAHKGATTPLVRRQRRVIVRLIEAGEAPAAGSVIVTAGAAAAGRLTARVKRRLPLR
jgi:hypothetical protein